MAEKLDYDLLKKFASMVPDKWKVPSQPPVTSSYNDYKYKEDELINMVLGMAKQCRPIMIKLFKERIRI